MAQTEQAKFDPDAPRTCHICKKVGHFVANCWDNPKRKRQPPKARRIIPDYMGQDEDMRNLQDPLPPNNVLENLLGAFERLPNDQKDELISRYEGKQEDFVEA